MTKANILIVEDMGIVAGDIKSSLKKLGFAVTGMVSSGKDAIKKVKADTPDLVLMDIFLKDEMNGIEAATIIQAKFNVPVVYLTTYTDEEVLGKAKITEPFGYIAIPFEDREMNTAIEIALYKHKIESHLHKAHKMETISTLAGGIAHDFNNLPGSIMGNVELARNMLPPETESSGFLSDAMESCIQARDLTKKFLLLSKGDEPKREAGIISESIKNYTNMALSGTNVKCEYRIAENLWIADFDKGQIGQVFSSIVTNAEEAMPEGGTITVEADNIIIDDERNIDMDEGQYVKTSIKDHGLGISSKDLESIFDPYFSTKDSFGDKGMGLGLSTALSIIKKHEGDIKVESKVGTGTTVSIYIPAHEKESVVLQPEKISISKESEIGSKKILVMDDEEALRFATRALLDILGHDAECCKNSDETIETYQKAKESGEPFDAVILDLTIQGDTGGKETIQKLLEIDPDVKGIVASGFSNDPIMAGFREYGFCEALPKPYLKDELAKAIGKVFSPEKEESMTS